MNSVNIDNEWHNGRLPIVNGIIHRDGTVERIDVDFDGEERKVLHRGRGSVDDLISKDRPGFSNIVIRKRLEINDRQVIVYCGEGSFGGDGFVVVESLADSRIIWIAFFESANPFENIEVFDDKIVAVNNLNEKWTFDMSNPSNMTVS